MQSADFSEGFILAWEVIVVEKYEVWEGGRIDLVGVSCRRE